MPDTNPSRIEIRSREQLFYTLTEAAEIEHNLMCCYLYAAFSLKDAATDGLSAEDDAMISRWRQAIIGVAVEEMTHLALVSNLLTAVGCAPHFSRPNFPISPGYHPAGVQVRLAPFSRETLQHFVYLERPDDSAEVDGDGFASPVAYQRGLGRYSVVMPSAQDYETVGDLYRAIADGIRHLADKYGDAGLFVGDPSSQVGPEVAALPGLIAVTGLATALRAIDTIVEQGEGASRDHETGHYRRFIAIRDEYDAARAARADFRPTRPAAHNPVMRRPIDPHDRVHIEAPAAAAALDLGNAVYGQMLRMLQQGFGRPGSSDEKRPFLEAAIDLMFALVPIAEHLTTLPARPDDGSCTAGLSFTGLRPVVALPYGPGEKRLLAERFAELSREAEFLRPTAPRMAQAADSLARTAASFAKSVGLTDTAATEQPASVTPAPAATPPNPAPPAETVETAEGRDLVLLFEARRCIHSRFCVTGAPKTFLANVQGPWLHPDETPVDRLVEIAHACPSGAIKYRRRDGKPEEAPPPVNLAGIRENGPYAIRAEILIDDQPAGYRLTLCRCGASQSKPFCDGSHARIGFAATGEPATGSAAMLTVRDGPLNVRPQLNGPLAVEGPLEIVSGTGRVVARVTRARLCRCGGSGNKPFCDGTHAKIGFRSS
jgi:CDGSH-type Zn-finger protein/uncharacterized Fe-S cluster protein YjdI